MATEPDHDNIPAPVPDAVGRELVACVNCGLCKTVRQVRRRTRKPRAAPHADTEPAQYEDSGCENCDPRAMQAHDIADHTTPNFSGLLAIMDPANSWCAKWVRKKKYCPGVYALHVNQG